MKYTSTHRNSIGEWLRCPRAARFAFARAIRSFTCADQICVFVHAQFKLVHERSTLVLATKNGAATQISKARALRTIARWQGRLQRAGFTKCTSGDHLGPRARHAANDDIN